MQFLGSESRAHVVELVEDAGVVGVYNVVCLGLGRIAHVWVCTTAHSLHSAHQVH